MALALGLIPKLARNDVSIHFSKNSYAPNEFFNYQHIKLDEGTRKKLSCVGIVYLEDLGIN